MCTIGSSYYKWNNGKDVNAFSMFKQCDLVDSTQFIEPILSKDDKTGIQYVAMTRERKGSAPAWAGINEYGVCFVAADSYLKEGDTCRTCSAETPSVFDMYLKTITSYHTAKEAMEFACNFYQSEFNDPDIFMVGDAKETYFIEAWNGTVACIKRENGFFASTNHFRMLYGGVSFEENHSTYLRLSRAEQILSVTPGLDGIGTVLRDKYFGETAWSICRSAENAGTKEEAYYTQASVIFYMDDQKNDSKPDITIEYVLNGKPDTGEIYKWKPFANGAKLNIDFMGNYSDLTD